MIRFVDVPTYRLFRVGLILLLGAVTATAASEGIYIEHSDIHRSRIDGSDVEMVLPGDTSKATGSFSVYQGPGGASLYWFGLRLVAGFGEGFMVRADLNGNNRVEIRTWGPFVGAFDTFIVDPASEKIYLSYWRDCSPNCGSINRMDLDGSNFESLFTADLPRGMAVDAAAGTIYWSDAHDDTLRRSNLDGTGEQTILTGVNSGSLALDLQAGKIYWVADTKIRRADLDGSNAEDIVTGLSKAWSLVLDPATDRMWWTDEYASRIQRSRLDGSEVTDLVTDIPGPEGMGVLRATGGQSEERLYWVDIAPPEVPAASGIALVTLVLVVVATSTTAVLRRRARNWNR